MKFQISQEYKQLQQRSRRLAQDFVTRVAEHDREASHPLENYAALRREGFNVMYRKRRTAGELDCLATSRRLRNWPKAALLPLFRSTCICRYALSIVGPLFENPGVPQATQQYIFRRVTFVCPAWGYWSSGWTHEKSYHR